jgi:hypothetical protein
LLEKLNKLYPGACKRSIYELMKIELEEAKRTFPKFYNVRVLSNDIDPYDWEGTCKMMEQKNIKREQWFKENFGE